MPVHADTKLNIHQREVEASKCGHTPGLQPLSLFPWISGNEKIISLPTISLPTWQANQCPWLLELCWLFAKGTGTDQMTDIKQFYQCSLNFFLIRKNVRNKLVSHKEWANSLAEHLTLCRHPFFCFVCFHMWYAAPSPMLSWRFSNKTRFHIYFFFTCAKHSTIFLKCCLFCSTFSSPLSRMNLLISIYSLPLGYPHMWSTQHTAGKLAMTWRSTQAHACPLQCLTLCQVWTFNRDLWDELVLRQTHLISWSTHSNQSGF